MIAGSEKTYVGSAAYLAWIDNANGKCEEKIVKESRVVLGWAARV